MKFNPNKIKIEEYARLSKNISKQEYLLEIINNNKEKYSPKEEDFIGFYDEKEVLNDISLKNNIKEKIKDQNKKDINGNNDFLENMKRISDIYEGVIVEQAEQNAWFGDNVNFYATSEYDDIINGVDGVAEFVNTEDTEDEDYVAMSFDVVFSGHSDRIVSKLEKTKKND